MGVSLKIVWQGSRPLIGTVIGVGIFALPYTFAQAGFLLGLAELLLVAGLNLVILFLYAELLAEHPGHGRFLKVVSEYLGPVGRLVAGVAYFGAHFGALTAYVLVGGEFAAQVFSPFLGGELIIYQLLFWAMGSVVILGGLLVVSRLQALTIPFFFTLMLILAIIAWPLIDVRNLSGINLSAGAVPLGALLFSFSGLSALPEMRDILAKHKHALKKSLILGTVFAAAIYALFTLMIVGIGGQNSPVEALSVFVSASNPLIGFVSSLMGLIIIFSVYMTIGVAMTNSLFFDHKLRYLLAWGCVISVPLLLFIFGARDVMRVIGLTGGVMSSLIGITLLIAYERARYSPRLPQNTFRIPQPLIMVVFVMFVGMLIFSVQNVLSF